MKQSVEDRQPSIERGGNNGYGVSVCVCVCGGWGGRVNRTMQNI